MDRLGIPVLLISVSWYGDTKDQRADLRCSHQEFRHSASWLPKAAVAWWAWTVQCFFGLNVAPIVTLTCDEMNYIVDSVPVGALRRSWKMSGFLRQVKAMQSFFLAQPSSVFFPLFQKVCWHVSNRMASSIFAGCIQRKRFDCFQGHNPFNVETHTTDTVSCGVQSKNVQESTEPVFHTQQNPSDRQTNAHEQILCGCDVSSSHLPLHTNNRIGSD